MQTTVKIGSRGERAVYIDMSREAFLELAHKFWTLGDYVLLTAVRQINNGDEK